MRTLIKVALVALGIRAFLRWRESRRQAQTTAPVQEGDPADELRRKLAESREEETGEAEESSPAAVADRRAEVHEQGRTALDEMKSPDES